jgi:hypothetical protein
MFDLVAVGHGTTIGLQVTSASNVSARVKKLTEAEALREVRNSNWAVIVHGWKKKGNEWVVKEVDIS